LAAVRSCFNS